MEIKACEFSDAGHGWLRVKLEDLQKVGGAYTPFSYYSGKYAYLEEDCDLRTFYELCKEKGIAVKITGQRYAEYSSIRRKSSWHGLVLGEEFYDKPDWMN